MIRWRLIAYYLSNMLYLLGFSQIVPIIFSIIVGESIGFILLLIFDLLIMVSLAYILRRISFLGEINIVEAYTVMVLAFIIPSFTFALPVMVYNVDFINALFEGASAITTTGLSALPPHTLTTGVHFLRSYYQWLGGIGIALLTLSFFLSPGTAAYNIYVAHLGKYKLKPLSISTIKIIVKIYIAFTLLYIFLYLVSGTPLLDAVLNSLTTISTGGFSRISSFKNGSMYMALFLMFMSAQPIAIYYFLFRGKLREILKDPQLSCFILISIIGFIAVSISVGNISSEILFQVISALSTTGYSAFDNKLLSEPAKFILSILMIIGAGFGSTGGGLKQLRIIIIFKSITANIKRLYMPKDAVIPVKIKNKVVSSSEILFSYTLLGMYLIVLIVSTYIISLYGYSIADSFFEASSALATTGLSVGISSPSLSFIPKITLIIDMWLGRVEIIPFIIVLTNLYYSTKKR